MSKTLAVLGALPLLWFVVFSLSRKLPGIFIDDPCRWGQWTRARGA